jgi:hypothetical protein
MGYKHVLEYEWVRDRPTNFARFFHTWNRLKIPGDREEARHQMVSQYTGGRTESMREMWLSEYNAMCYDLEHGQTRRRTIKSLRHQCLSLMADIGVNSQDWDKVNGFCRHVRICGTEFGKLTEEQLEDLKRKLWAIKRKGGLKDVEFFRPAGKKRLVMVLRWGKFDDYFS